MDYQAILKALTVFDTPESVVRWIKERGLFLTDAIKILDMGNRRIKSLAYQMYDEQLQRFDIYDQEKIEYALKCNFDPDTKGVLKKFGAGAGIGAAAAIVASGPFALLTVAGGMLGLGAARQRDIEVVKSMLVENSKYAAKIYADRVEKLLLSKNTKPYAYGKIHKSKENKTAIAPDKANAQNIERKNHIHTTEQVQVKAECSVQSNNKSSEKTTIKSSVADNRKVVNPTTTIKVIHKVFGKGTIESVVKNTNLSVYINVSFGGISKVFSFPSIFTDQKFGGMLDIERDFVNSQNAINFIVENDLIVCFEKINRNHDKTPVSWLQECIDRYILLQELKGRGFIGFLHTTQFDNFKSIYQGRYMLSRKKLLNDGVAFVDCADSEIIGGTDTSVKESNRFYYRCKTPTNYSAMKKCGQTRPVIFLLDSNAIYDTSVVFYDGNARANKSSHTSYAYVARTEFNWDCIFCELPPYQKNDATMQFIREQACELEDLKRMQNAELLFKDNIDVYYFEKIYFMNRFDYNEAVKLFGENPKFEYKPEMFPIKRYL